ncbi:adenosine deaminase [candidate division KSB1 bacterium]|nr:adenosine deaminase [candidate division KSB1 bacterium]
MKQKSTDKDFITKMPKIELHLHLEGAFMLESLMTLIDKYGGDPSINSVEELEKKFIFKDFPHFIETWVWKNQFFKSPEDFEFTTYHTLKDLHKQNVVYTEAFYSPWDFAGNGLGAQEITEAHLSAVNRAEKNFGIQCKLIADISRDVGWENSVQRFKQIIPYRDLGVIGIGLGGSEQQYPNELYEDVFKLAKQEGFHVVAHAGEAAGAESVLSVLDVLKAERIGHGVRAIEDPDLIDKLKENKIPLEVCVTSNLKTGVFPSLEEHPIKEFFEQGLAVNINTDDPTMFGTTLTDEFLLLYDGLNFSIDDINKLTINAVDATFLSEDEKRELKTSFEMF